ncbi:MAG TPA: hypothetical protein VFR64_15235 [Methylomirabilota bacterium]|nr:hypothetical protein [Methylomirabilota bacterium]
MLDNATYDLMETVAVLSKGLHRYETFQRDARDCPECLQIWTYMRKTEEDRLLHRRQIRRNPDIDWHPFERVPEHLRRLRGGVLQLADDPTGVENGPYFQHARTPVGMTRGSRRRAPGAGPGGL